MHPPAIVVVIADVSGSMFEMGKDELMRNILAFVRELPRIQPAVFFDLRVQLFLWGEGIAAAEDIPSAPESSRPSLEKLLTFLLEREAKESERVLLLTDGRCGDGQSREAFAAGVAEAGVPPLEVVGIGADHDEKNARVLGSGVCYPAWDVLAAVTGGSRPGATGPGTAPPTIEEAMNLLI